MSHTRTLPDLSFLKLGSVNFDSLERAFVLGTFIRRFFWLERPDLSEELASAIILTDVGERRLSLAEALGPPVVEDSNIQSELVAGIEASLDQAVDVKEKPSKRADDLSNATFRLAQFVSLFHPDGLLVDLEIRTSIGYKIS